MGRLNQTSLYTFTDASGSTYPYSTDFETAYDDTYIRNHIEVNAPDGTRGRTGSGIAVDTTSSDDYGIIVDSVSSQLKSGGERQGLAEYRLFLYKQPAERVPSLRLNPAGKPGTLWPAALGLEVSDAITVKRFAGSGDEKTLELNVEGKRHSCRPGGPWVTEIRTSPRDTRTFLQIAHATRGKVGAATSNRLPGIGERP